MTNLHTENMDITTQPNPVFHHLGRIVVVLELGAQASTAQPVDYPKPNH